MKLASLILLVVGLFNSGCAIYTSDSYGYGSSSSWEPAPPQTTVHSEPVVASLPSRPPPRPPVYDPPPMRPPYVAAPPYAQSLPVDHSQAPIAFEQIPLDSGHKGHHKGKPMQQSFQQASDSDW